MLKAVEDAAAREELAAGLDENEVVREGAWRMRAAALEGRGRGLSGRARG